MSAPPTHTVPQVSDGCLYCGGLSNPGPPCPGQRRLPSGVMLKRGEVTTMNETCPEARIRLRAAPSAGSGRANPSFPVCHGRSRTASLHGCTGVSSRSGARITSRRERSGGGTARCHFSTRGVHLKLLPPLPGSRKERTADAGSPHGEGFGLPGIPCYWAGLMFWLAWKRLSGSYVRLTCASRS